MDFEAKLPGGGLGSSCSSLILGEETGGGEALRDTSWGGSVEVMGPLADKKGFDDHGLLAKGPEKACLLFFLVSNGLCVSRGESECPSDKGGGSWVEELLLIG